MDFSKVKRYPINKRNNKVSHTAFAGLPEQGTGFSGFIDSLPDILAGKDVKDVVSAIVTARKKDKPVIVCMGGHVVKCGLSPVIVDLMRRGTITGVAMNGAASIHDFEIAMIGETSEDVGNGLVDGSFGMAEETGRMMNEAMKAGLEKEEGAGTALGRKILEHNFPHREISILAQAALLKLPLTVHIAIGTDILHQHPEAEGTVLGEASFRDFKVFTSMVMELGEGGVLINLGSAVIMPEVFLKALTVARNLGKKITNFTTVDLDMIRHYRPLQNVVSRPVTGGGKGISLTGHHELMLPLLRQAIIEKMRSEQRA